MISRLAHWSGSSLHKTISCLMSPPTMRLGIGVFKPRLVAEICTTSAETVLKAADPFGHFTRKLRPGASERLQLLFLEVFGAQADTGSVQCRSGIRFTFGMVGLSVGGRTGGGAGSPPSRRACGTSAAGRVRLPLRRAACRTGRVERVTFEPFVSSTNGNCPGRFSQPAAPPSIFTSLWARQARVYS